MYENVGKKIMMLAKVLGWIFLAAGVIAFIVLLAMEFSDGIAFASLAGGVLMYISSWFLYGFGQLVDDVRIIRNAPPIAKNEVVSDELPEL